VKTYRRKPIVMRAFKWDGKPNEHVKLLGPVQGGHVPCNHCILPWAEHGELINPAGSTYSVLCRGRWVVIGPDGSSEFMSEADFKAQYEECDAVGCEACPPGKNIECNDGGECANTGEPIPPDQLNSP